MRRNSFWSQRSRWRHCSSAEAAGEGKKKKKKDRKKTAWQVCWIKSRHVIWSWKCLFKKRNILKYFLGKFLDYVMSLILGIYVVNKPPSNSIYYFNKLPLYSPTKTVDFFHFFFFFKAVWFQVYVCRVWTFCGAWRTGGLLHILIVYCDFELLTSA